MKITHKVRIPWDYIPPSHIETDDRYLGELEAARRKAEKAWRNAQAALERAKRRLKAKPDPDLLAAKEAALVAFEARERELHEIERLMRSPASSQPRVVQRSGADDRLEVGVYRKPRRKRATASSVTVTKKGRSK